MSASPSDGDVGASHPHHRRRGALLASAATLLLVALALTAVPASAAGRTVAPRTTVVVTNVHHPLHTAPPRAGAFTNARPAVVSPIGYIPCDVANAYHVSGNPLTGTGLVIAIIDPFVQPAIMSDLQSFDSTFGLPDPTFNVIQPFGPPGASPPGSNWDLEITLDVEWAHAMAPGATIDLVETVSNNFSLPVGQTAGDLTSGVFYATNTLNADVVSMSWGTGEGNLSSSTEASLNGYFPSVNGAGRPITFLASAGDSGFGAGWPAIAPGVVGVGGTSLAPAAFGYSAQPATHTDCGGVTSTPGVSSGNETVWGNDPVQCSSTACNGTGGGPSATEAKPSWQSIAPGTTRVSPDVSMLADPFTGVALFFQGTWINGTIGGTSLAAPMWAGIVARLDQERRGMGQATLNTTTAASWAYSASSGDFNDITTGSAPPTPGNACIANGTCAANAGYDEVTGRGSPIVSALMADLGGFDSQGGFLTATPAVSSWSSNRMDLFARGGDGALWHKSWNGSSWTGWESLGGLIIGAPAAVSWGVDRIDVLARGGDNALWHRAWTGSSWSGWESLGGGLSDGPAVSSWAVNRLDAFIRGGDNALWHKSWNGIVWSGWESLGGAMISAPAAVSWGVGRIDMFVRGGDSTLWHKAWAGGSWSGWEPRGGQVGSAPAAASTAPGRLTVPFVGTNGILQRETWDGGSWINSFPTSGLIWQQMGTAAVSRAGTGTVDVFVVGPDGAVWHTVS